MEWIILILYRRCVRSQHAVIGTSQEEYKRAALYLVRGCRDKYWLTFKVPGPIEDQGGGAKNELLLLLLCLFWRLNVNLFCCKYGCKDVGVTWE